MADEPFALSTIPPELPAQAEYDAICAAVMATMRGRWFLQEYSRRNRNIDIRTVLAAIERIESVIQSEHANQAQQQHRIELLEMARTIARIRADVPEVKPAPAADASDSQTATETVSDVIAAAQRLHDVAWAMREQGISSPTSDQIEALATTLLSASSLRNPDDGRARRLAEVLHYLERRIDKMLDTPAQHAVDMHMGVGAEAGGEPPALAAELAEPIAGAAAGDDVQRKTADRAPEPPDPALGKQADATPGAAASESTVDAEVDSDLGLLAAAPEEPGAPNLEESNNEPPSTSPSAASEASSDEAIAVITADPVASAAIPATPESTQAPAATAPEPAPTPLVKSSPGHTMLASVWEFELPNKRVETPTPTMWEDSATKSAAGGKPAAGSITADGGVAGFEWDFEPYPKPVASNAAQSSVQAFPPLPADFLLDPLSAPLSESVVSKAAPASPAAGNGINVDDELFAAPAKAIAALEPATAPSPIVEPAIAAASQPATSPPAPLVRNDPFAALHAMSDEERIALFT